MRVKLETGDADRNASGGSAHQTTLPGSTEVGISVRTEPTRGDVRGNENWNSSASETLQDMVSLALTFVAVNSANTYFNCN